MYCVILDGTQAVILALLLLTAVVWNKCGKSSALFDFM